MNAVVGHENPAVVDEHRDGQTVMRLWERRAAFKPFAIAGTIGVIAGGALAAGIAAPAPTRHGVWASAFLVLVIGVAQVVLGIGMALLPTSPPKPALVAAVVAGYNIGGLLVMAGIVGDRIVVFDIGSVVLFAALVASFVSVRRSTQRGLLPLAFRLMLLVLVACIPIGAVLTTLGPH